MFLESSKVILFWLPMLLAMLDLKVLIKYMPFVFYSTLMLYRPIPGVFSLINTCYLSCQWTAMFFGKECTWARSDSKKARIYQFCSRCSWRRTCQAPESRPWTNLSVLAASCSWLYLNLTPRSFKARCCSPFWGYNG